ncbi:MAG: glycerophosphoryl diester phosphodiesterase membrane domain-containing protein [Tsuneonella sp.]
MKFDMTRAWNDAVALIGANRAVVSIVAGVFFFLPYALFMMLTAEQMTALQATAERAEGDVAMNAMMAFYGSVWWEIVLIMIFQGIGMLGLLALLTDRSRPTVGEALMTGLRFTPSYIAAQIIMSFALGLLLLVPVTIGAGVSVAAGVLVGVVAVLAMIYVFTKFSLAAPVFVQERTLNPFAAIGRSWRLTKGNSLRLWLFYFLLLVAIAVVGMVASIVIGLFLALLGPETALAGQALVSGALNAVWVTLFMAALAAAYRQLAGDTAAAVGETFA